MDTFCQIRKQVRSLANYIGFCSFRRPNLCPPDEGDKRARDSVFWVILYTLVDSILLHYVQIADTFSTASSTNVCSVSVNCVVNNLCDSIVLSINGRFACFSFAVWNFFMVDRRLLMEDVHIQNVLVFFSSKKEPWWCAWLKMENGDTAILSWYNVRIRIHSSNNGQKLKNILSVTLERGENYVNNVLKKLF